MAKYLYDKETGKSLLVTAENMERVKEAYQKNKSRFVLQKEEDAPQEEVQETVEPKLGPEHKEFDKPLREMSPEARAWVIAQRTGQPYQDVYGMSTAIPKTVAGIGEGEVNLGDLASDAGSLMGRWVTSAMGGQPMKDIESEGFIQGVTRSPEVGLSALGGGLGSLASKGAGTLARMGGLAVGEGTGDIIGKQAQGIEVTPSEALSSYGFGALGGLGGKVASKGAGTVADVAKFAGDSDKMLREYAVMTGKSEDALKFATDKSNWKKLKEAFLDEKIPRDLINQLDGAKPSSKTLETIDNALGEMPEIDLNEAIKTLKSSKVKGATVSEAEDLLNRKLDAQIKRFQNKIDELNPSESITENVTTYDQFGMPKVEQATKVAPKKTTIPAKEFLDLRKRFDKGINFDEMAPDSQEMINKALKKTRGKMREQLIASAPDGEYRKAMEELTNFYQAKDNLSMHISKNPKTRYKSANTFINTIEAEGNVDAKTRLEAFDKLVGGGDLAKRAEARKIAREFGGEPTWAPKGTTGKFIPDLKNFNTSPRFYTDIVAPSVEKYSGPLNAIDVLRGKTPDQVKRLGLEALEAGTSQGIQQMSEGALMNLLGARDYE